MPKEPIITVDLRDFKKSATKFMRKDYPEAIANFAKILAVEVEDIERKGLAQDLNLMSKWIPRQINAFPKKPGQVKKIRDDVRDKNKFIASVQGNEKIGFMTGHNDTAIRKTQTNWNFGPDTISGMLAVPAEDLTKAYRTKTGKVKKKYYPTELLKDWKGVRGPKPGKRRKKAFLIKNYAGLPIIAKRKTLSDNSKLLRLWRFIPRAKIKKDWNFDERGEKAVIDNYTKAIAKAWQKLK